MFLVVHASPAASDDAGTTPAGAAIFWFVRTGKMLECAPEYVRSQGKPEDFLMILCDP